MLYIVNPTIMFHRKCRVGSVLDTRKLGQSTTRSDQPDSSAPDETARLMHRTKLSLSICRNEMAMEDPQESEIGDLHVISAAESWIGLRVFV